MGQWRTDRLGYRTVMLVQRAQGDLTSTNKGPDLRAPDGALVRGLESLIQVPG